MKNEYPIYPCEQVAACPVLAMAYVPIQRLGNLYAPEAGLCRGTIFPELDKPFYGRTIEGGIRHD